MPKYSKKQLQEYLYISIFTDFSNENLNNVVKKTCPRGFTTKKCQKIFTIIIINIFYTLTFSLKTTKKRRKTIEEFNNLIPVTDVTILPIEEYQLENIRTFCYLMQDMTYGQFYNAYYATLLYNLIDDT